MRGTCKLQRVSKSIHKSIGIRVKVVDSKTLGYMFGALLILVLRSLKYIYLDDLIKDLASSVLISICKRIWVELKSKQIP